MSLALVLKESQMLLATGRGVLRADEAQALGDVAELLRWGHDEARRLREQAEQAAREIEAQAVAEAERRVQDAVAAAVAETHARAAALLAEVEPLVAEAVAQVLERLGAGLDRGALLARAIDEARHVVDAGQLAVLTVAPEDLAAAADAVARMAAASHLPATLEVRAEPGLAPGHCVLRSPAGLYRFGLAQQLEALRAAWQRHRPAGAAAPGEPALAGDAIAGRGDD